MKRLYFYAAVTITLVELFFCFFGPIAFNSKPAILITPASSRSTAALPLQESEAAIQEGLAASGSFLITTPRMAAEQITMKQDHTDLVVTHGDYLAHAKDQGIERVVSLTLDTEPNTEYYRATIILWNSILGEAVKTLTLSSPGYYDLPRQIRSQMPQLIQSPGGLTLFDWLILLFFLGQIYAAWRLRTSQYFDTSPVDLLRSRLTTPTLGWRARRLRMDPPPTLEGLGSAAFWRAGSLSTPSSKPSATSVPTPEQAITTVRHRIRTKITDSGVLVEVLLGFGGILLLFAWIYALNANMDYVRRFITLESSFRIGKTVTEAQTEALLRFGPLLLLNTLAYLLPRLSPRIMPRLWFFQTRKQPGPSTPRRKRLPKPNLGTTLFGFLSGSLSGFSRLDNWLVRINRSYTSQVAGLRPLWIAVSGYRLPLTILSALLYSLAFPSESSLSGLPLMAWIALVPLFWVIKTSSFTQTVFYGTLFGVMQGIMINYWHSTFGIIALPLSAVATAFGFFIYMVILGGLRNLVYSPRVLGRHDWILLPLSWVVFDYVRSLGFAGYPWGYIGVSQYLFPRITQLADLTGIWGISFLVVLFNAVIAHVLLPYPTRKTPWANLPHIPITARRRLPIITITVLLVCTLIYGQIRLATFEPLGDTIHIDQGDSTLQPSEPDSSLSLYLIQQNTDPRKHSTQHTLSRLSNLSATAPAHSVIVWPEGAIPPGFPSQSAQAGGSPPPSYLPNQYLLSGATTTGPEAHNTALYLSPEGKILSQYHKIKLVPITEHIPTDSIWSLLTPLFLPFHPHRLSPGTAYQLHSMDDWSVATPICFEDTFPDHIRQFVRKGADLILVLSNDYWSLTPVQSMQHTIHASFRSIETRTPMVRATTSGLSGVIDYTGQLLEPSIGFYTEGTLSVTLENPTVPEATLQTLYLSWGDWLPIAALIVFSAICLVVLLLRTSEVLLGIRRYWAAGNQNLSR